MPHTCTQRPMNFAFTLGNDLLSLNLSLIPFSSSLAQKLCLLTVSLAWGLVYAFGLANASEDFVIWITLLAFPILTGPFLPCFLELTAQPCPALSAALWQGSSHSTSRFSPPISQENCLIHLKIQNALFPFDSPQSNKLQ